MQVHNRSTSPTNSSPRPQCPAARPDIEWWRVGEDRYESTADLISSGKVTEQGIAADYGFQENSKLNRDLKSEIPGRIVKGLAYGAATGLAFGAAVNVMGGILDVFTLGMLGVNYGGWAAFAGGGAALGVMVGVFDLYESQGDYERYGEQIPGTLIKGYDATGQEELRFHPHGELGDKVNLGEHAGAPVYDPNSDCAPWWKDAGYSPLS